MCVHVCVCIYECMCVGTHACVHACVRAFVCVCVCVCDCGVQCLHMLTASFPSTRPHALAVKATSSLGALHV